MKWNENEMNDSIDSRVLNEYDEGLFDWLREIQMSMWLFQ